MNKTIAIIGGFTALAVIVASVLFVGYSMQQVSPNLTASLTATQEETPGAPKHLSIPSIGVDATITPSGLAANGTIAVPEGPFGVNWYNAGPRPGEQGSAILTGHFGPWRTGEKSVFDNLNQLKAGDKIYVTDDQGKQLTFVVKKTQTYGLNEKPDEVFIKNDKAYLNLITCSGDWLSTQKTYTNRLVVFTELEEN